MTHDFSDDTGATRLLTERLVKCSLQFLFKDGSKLDYKINGDYKKEAHPYANLDRTNLQSVCILNADGTQRWEPVTIPDGKTVAYRLRTMIVNGAVNKFIVLGIVNKTTQTLHRFFRDGKSDVIENPTLPAGSEAKINLRKEECV